MEVFLNGYYRINRVFLCLCGIWPEQRLLEAYVVRIFVLGSIFSIMVPEIVYLYAVAVGGSIMDDVIPCIPTQLSIFIGLVKFYMVASQKQTFQIAIDKIRNDWIILDGTPASELMHTYAARGRFNTIFYITFVFSGVHLFMAFPLSPIFMDYVSPLNESRPRGFLFDTDYGFENQDDHFVFITIHCYFAAVSNMHLIWTVDSFIMIMVQHCCGLFEIVGFTVQRLNTENEKMSEEIERDMISYAVDIHKRAISFAEFIEDTLKTTYAVVIFLNMVGISLTGVETVMKMEQTDQALSFATFTLGQISHLFFNSLPGQILVDHSSHVFDLIYDANWQSTSVKSQKSIMIMLLRSSKPSMLTAGGFYQVNMENFSQVIRTSMSYLTVLLSMR